MANVNKIILIGNLTRDVEVRHTPKGTPVGEAGLAVNRVRTMDDGTKHEEVTFVDVTFWGSQAELARDYLGRGRQVYIEGRLHMDSWEDKNGGGRRTKLKVVCENMQFLGDKQDGQGSSGGQKQDYSPPSTPPQRGSGNKPPLDEQDDIPF